MSIKNKAKLLVKYIKTLPDFKREPLFSYKGHMGAIITDAILQPGIDWNNVVKPRIQRILQDFSEDNTTTKFLKLLKRLGPSEIIQWKGKEKINRLMNTVHFLKKEKIETKKDLKTWLLKEDNQKRLMNLRGIGRKTLNYFKILSGISTTAIDRHLINFIKKAGICIKTIPEAEAIIKETAKLLKVKTSILDYSIWKYMSDKKESCRNYERKN